MIRCAIWLWLLVAGPALATGRPGAGASTADPAGPVATGALSDCSDARGYDLLLVADPARAPPEPGTTPQVLEVVARDGAKTAIGIPTDADAMGFSLEAVEKTGEGFAITVEFGSRYYRRKRFDFACTRDGFVLRRIAVEGFDKGDPESMDRWDRKVLHIHPALPVAQFSMFDYLED